MNFQKILETAWRLTIEHIVSLILLTLALFIVSFITLGILAPVCMVGYTFSLQQVIRRNRPPKFSDLFSHMRLFFPLLGFGILVFLFILIGLAILVLPGIIISILISYTCLYMYPILVDEKTGVIDAVKASANMVYKGNIIEQVVIYLLFAGITAIGNAVFIGGLITIPFATLILLSAYEDRKNNPVIIL